MHFGYLLSNISQNWALVELEAETIRPLLEFKKFVLTVSMSLLLGNLT